MHEQKLYDMSQLKRASHIVPIVPSSNTTKFGTTGDSEINKKIKTFVRFHFHFFKETRG